MSRKIFKQLEFGFEQEIQARELQEETTIKIFSDENRALFVKRLYELHEVRKALSNTDVLWCKRLASFFRANGFVTNRQFGVIANIHSRLALE